MHFKFFYIVLLSLILMGCSVKELKPMERQQHIEQLTSMLLALDRSIDKEEAKDLAKSSIDYSRDLAEKYKLVAPPLWHNTLINFGLKERGLCYEWANDLLVYLLNKKYRTLMFHRIGSNIGSYFEHNALSVSAKDSDVHQSIVLDAWRHSGNLYFIEFDKDIKYSWKERYDLK